MIVNIQNILANKIKTYENIERIINEFHTITLIQNKGRNLLIIKKPDGNTKYRIKEVIGE